MKIDIPNQTEQMVSNARKEINKSQSLWIVEKGSGELFIQKKESGHLLHVASIGQGDLFLGFPDDPFLSVLMIANEPVELKEVQAEAFYEWLKNSAEAFSTFLTPLFSWIHQFDALYLSFKREEIHVFLSPGETLTLEQDQTFEPSLSTLPEHKNDISWIVLEEGSLSFLNFEEVILKPSNVPYPLTHHTWFQAKEKARVRSVKTEEVLKGKESCAAFFALQKNLLIFFRAIYEAQEKREKEGGKARILLDEDLLAQSMKNMGRLLEKEEPWIASSLTDPIAKACQLLGHITGISFLMSREFHKETVVEKKIKTICRVSKVGFRQVVLMSEWWKKDSLPLLGFYKDDGRPVVLINPQGHGYLLVDPDTEKGRKVDKEMAAKLSPQAYAFYPPFPPGKLSALTLIKFCLKKHLREVKELSLVAVFGACLSLLPPMFNEILFNKVIKPYDATLLPQVILGLFLATISIGVFLFVRSYAILRLMQISQVKLESAFWDRLLALPVRFFRRFTVGNLVQRAYATTQIRELFGGNVIRVLFSGIFSFFYLLAMFYYSPMLTVTILAVLAVAVFFLAILVFLKTAAWRLALSESGTLQGIVVQLIAGVSKLRIGGAEARGFAYWAKAFSGYQKYNFQTMKYKNMIKTLTLALPIFSQGVIFVTLILMSYGQPTIPISLGAFIAFLTAYVAFSTAIFDAVGTVSHLISAVPYWERAKVILEAEPERVLTKEKPGKLFGQVTVDHVFFRYDKEGPMLLNNLSLYANPGEMVGIVGSSSSGKTTIVRLLLGFETPENGSVYYDEKNLAALDPLELRRQVGTVLQDGSLFSGTLYENICCGGLYSKKEIDEAIGLSGFDKDLDSFPMGLQTFVQSGGATLSGGQAQRLLISRALIGKPKILIFDEATSALDNKTQQEISTRLEALEVTRIVIAHRLTTIQHADRIYVLDRGKIVQEGNFTQLSTQEGLFKQLVSRQQL